jgi:hypothetical protein
VRTSQSVAIQARVCSSPAFVAVPMTRSAYGLSFCRKASSTVSFQERRNAAIAGETHAG